MQMVIEMGEQYKEELDQLNEDGEGNRVYIVKATKATDEAIQELIDKYGYENAGAVLRVGVHALKLHMELLEKEK
jgi:hypothetical protein